MQEIDALKVPEKFMVIVVVGGVETNLWVSSKVLDNLICLKGIRIQLLLVGVFQTLLSIWIMIQLGCDKSLPYKQSPYDILTELGNWNINMSSDMSADKVGNINNRRNSQRSSRALHRSSRSISNKLNKLGEYGTKKGKDQLEPTI